ncbi:MAG: histidine kinase dimerization/phospho-acceptor domain-containing protein, partial [Pseudomonadota bacterium]
LYLAVWIPVYLIFTAGRIDIFRRYFRASKHQRTRDEAVWRGRFYVLMMLYGTMQVLLIAPAIAFAPIEQAMLLTFMIVFSGALVSSIMPLSKKNLRSYLALTLGTVAAAWLLAPDGYGWAIAVGLVGCGAAFHKTGIARLAAIEQTHQLGLQLAESNALLKQTNVTRSRLTMEASHDLRQPVQALTLMADLLRTSKDSTTFDARVRDIEICTASLADMLSELMEFSRLDLGGYAPQQQAVPIDDVLNELNAVLASVALSKRLEWSVKALPMDVR